MGERDRIEGVREKMKQLAAGLAGTYYDQERNHVEADGLLRELAESLAILARIDVKDILESYDSIEKWYA